jgi:hypothetical protein
MSESLNKKMSMAAQVCMRDVQVFELEKVKSERNLCNNGAGLRGVYAQAISSCYCGYHDND